MNKIAKRFLHLICHADLGYDRIRKFGTGDDAVLGGTQAEWDEIVTFLRPNYRCVTIDLPGFGAASSVMGYPIEAMAIIWSRHSTLSIATKRSTGMS